MRGHLFCSIPVVIPGIICWCMSSWWLGISSLLNILPQEKVLIGKGFTCILKYRMKKPVSVINHQHLLSHEIFMLPYPCMCSVWTDKWRDSVFLPSDGGGRGTITFEGRVSCCFIFSSGLSSISISFLFSWSDTSSLFNQANSSNSL